MDVLTNKLANALSDLYLECRAMGWNGMAEEMQNASGALDEYRNAVGKEILAATDAQADMDAEPLDLGELLIVVTGDPTAGFRFTGPFNTNEAAEEAAGNHFDSAWTAPLNRPEAD